MPERERGKKKVKTKRATDREHSLVTVRVSAAIWAEM